jgi:hypothetical protein
VGNVSWQTASVHIGGVAYRVGTDAAQELSGIYGWTIGYSAYIPHNKTGP